MILLSVFDISYGFRFRNFCQKSSVLSSSGPCITAQLENRGDCRSHCKDKGAEIFSYKASSDECACKEVDGGILRSESGWVTGPVRDGLAPCEGIFFKFFNNRIAVLLPQFIKTN